MRGAKTMAKDVDLKCNMNASLNEKRLNNTKGDIAMASKETENLKRLARTAIIMNFVKSKNGFWNHQDWLTFLFEVKKQGFDPIDTDQLGLLLEERRAQYFSSRHEVQ
jgi:hypothetical protein